MMPSTNGIPVVFSGVSQDIWMLLRKRYPGNELVLHQKDVNAMSQELGEGTPQTIWDAMRRFESRGLLQNRVREGTAIKWRITEVKLGVIGGSKPLDSEKPTVIVPEEGNQEELAVVLPSLYFSREVKDDGDFDWLRIYQKDIGPQKVMTRQEEQELFHRYRTRNDGKAREEIICRNLRLVLSIALKYRQRGLSLMDVVQYGNLGLLRAVQDFDHTRGFKFSTYAFWWIRQSVWRGLQNDVNTIRVPVHIYDGFNKLLKATKKLKAEGVLHPSVEQIANKAEMLVPEVEKLMEYSRTARVTELEATIFISGKGSNEEGSTLGAFIEDKTFLSPETVAMAERAVRRFHRQLEWILEKVEKYSPSRRYLSILVLYLGLDNPEYGKRTMEEVREILHMGTRSRVQQMIEKACLSANIQQDDLKWLVERIRIAAEVTGKPAKTYDPKLEPETQVELAERKLHLQSARESRDAKPALVEEKKPLTIESVEDAQQAYRELSEEWKIFVDKVRGRYGNRFSEILVKRYGFDTPDLERRSLEEVGKLFNVTKSRIGQVIDKACQLCDLTPDELGDLADRIQAAKRFLDASKVPVNGKQVSKPAFNYPRIAFAKPSKNSHSPRLTCIVPDHRPTAAHKSPELQPEHVAELRKLESALGSFPLMEGKVFGLYYGICGNTRMGLPAIASEFGIPEPNVQRIIKRTLVKLAERQVVSNVHWLLAVLNRRS